MNHLKKLGVAVLLAVAAMAFLGAGSAAAEQSVFCKVNETPCKSENRYPKGTAVVLGAKGPLTWTTYWEGGEVIHLSCQGQEFKGEITSPGGSGETAEIALNTQFVNGCSCGITLLGKMKMKFNWTSGTMNASVSSEGPSYAFNCYNPFWGGEFQCSFEGTLTEGVTLTGGNPATLTYKETPTQVTGKEIPCGTEARLNAEFEVVSPKPLYVSTA